MKCLIWILALLAATTSSLAAGSSASHTIIIQVVRPNEFAVKPVESQESLSVNQSNKSTFSLNWKTSNQDKRITVSTVDSENSGRLVLDEDTEIILDQQPKDLTTSLSSREGNYKLRYVSDTASLNQPTRLVYTMTDF